MHILILTDLEGVSGVDKFEMMTEGTAGFEQARENITKDVNITIEGAFAGGATKVTVIDGHGHYNNIIDDMLDSRAERLNIKDFCVMNVSDMKYDGLFVTGAHAMAGTENAFLDHTQAAISWFEYKLNGEPCGEIGMLAYLVGLNNIPLLMVNGDEAACREVEALVPGVVTAAVKTANERNVATCYPEAEVNEKIFNAAKKGAESIGKIKALKLTMPAIMELTYSRSDFCDESFKDAQNTERYGRTLRKKLDKINCYYDIVRF